MFLIDVNCSQTFFCNGQRRKVQNIEETKNIHNNDFDVILVYPATGSGRGLLECCSAKKDNIIFVRHQSGPVYYWYEALSTAYLKCYDPERQKPVHDKNIHVEDVVVDDYGIVTCPHCTGPRRMDGVNYDPVGWHKRNCEGQFIFADLPFTTGCRDNG